MSDLYVFQSGVSCSHENIEVDFHYIHEQVAARQLGICVISSQDQTAYLLTKALPRP